MALSSWNNLPHTFKLRYYWLVVISRCLKTLLFPLVLRLEHLRTVTTATRAWQMPKHNALLLWALILPAECFLFEAIKICCSKCELYDFEILLAFSQIHLERCVQLQMAAKMKRLARILHNGIEIHFPRGWCSFGAVRKVHHWSENFPRESIENQIQLRATESGDSCKIYNWNESALEMPFGEISRSSVLP